MWKQLEHWGGDTKAGEATEEESPAELKFKRLDTFSQMGKGLSYSV